MSPSPKEDLLSTLIVDGKSFRFYNLSRLFGREYDKLPYSLRILLECLVRKSDKDDDDSQHEDDVWRTNIDKVLAYRDHAGTDILFHPSRVLLQDFTGVPALIDLASLRDVIEKRGGDPAQVDSLCPADLVVDHTVQLDYCLLYTSPSPRV